MKVKKCFSSQLAIQPYKNVEATALQTIRHYFIMHMGNFHLIAYQRKSNTTGCPVLTFKTKLNDKLNTPDEPCLPPAIRQSVQPTI